MIVLVVGNVTSEQCQPLWLAEIQKRRKPRIKRIDMDSIFSSMSRFESDIAWDMANGLAPDDEHYYYDARNRFIRGLLGAQVATVVYDEPAAEEEDLESDLREAYPAAEHYVVRMGDDGGWFLDAMQ